MKLVILVAIISAVCAIPLENALYKTDINTRNSVFEGIILQLLEDLRETMLTGSDDIPVLDPLDIDELHLQLDELGLPNSHLTIADTEVIQLSTFVIEDLTFTSTSILLQRYELGLDGHIPVIEVDCAKYDLAVNAMGVSVFGAGDAKIQIIKPRITAKIQVGLSIIGGISINIRAADVVFYLEAFEAEISEVINSIIEGIGSIDLNREDMGDIAETFDRLQSLPANA